MSLFAFSVSDGLKIRRTVHVKLTYTSPSLKFVWLALSYCCAFAWYTTFTFHILTVRVLDRRYSVLDV